MRLQIFGALVLLGVLTPSASAAEMTSLVTKAGKVVLTLTGEIAEGDAEKFKEFAKGANANNRLVSGIRLNSVGGNLLEAVKVADLVRYAKIATVVGNNAKCASACFIIFAAGYEKYANYTASIGVHGASDRNGQETVISGAATVSMARVAKELGVPPDIIGKMVTTPPEKMVWLAPKELAEMGTSMVGKPSQVPRPEETVEDKPPVQLAPETQAKAPPPSWDQIVQKALAASESQNNGRPRLIRTCQPELKTCVNAIYLKGKNGKDMMVKKTEDMNGKIVSREVCEFNDFRDVRSCFDWDTNLKHRDMKNSKGDWFQIADE